MDLKKLEEKLGYTFKKQELLVAALTHKSYSYESNGKIKYNNEKLEFLGDSVLSIVISDLIYKKNTDFTEGQLSKLRSSLINEYALTQIALQLSIGKFILLGRGEELTGGRKKPSLLSNTYEAILAAIFLDSGFRTVYKIVKRHFSDSFFKLSPINLDRDYKSQLQEKSHKLYKTSPKYKLIKKSGPDHKQTFKVEVIISKKTISKGSGNSKKEAEQDAAQKALKILEKCEPK